MANTQHPSLCPPSTRRPIARSRLDRERRQAGRLWPRLSAVSPRRLEDELRREGARPTWGLFARFLTASRSAAARDPNAALRWARSAIAIAGLLPSNAYRQLALCDLRGAGLVAEAEALRFLGRPLIARDRVRKARDLLSRAPDVRFLSEIDRVGAAIAADLGEGDTADHLSRRGVLSIPICFDGFERLRLHLGRALAVAPFDAFAARDACFQAIDLSFGGSRRHQGIAWLQLASALVEIGWPDEAARILPVVAPLSRDLDVLGGIHSLWIAARIDACRDDLRTLLLADKALQEVIARLGALGRERDRALAELDLILVEILTGRMVAGLRRVDSLAARLAERGAHSEIEITLRLLFKLLVQHADPREVLDQARTYLAQSWWLPRRGGRRTPSRWSGAEVPFGHLAHPISRAYTDYRTFEAGMHVSMSPFRLTEIFASWRRAAP